MASITLAAVSPAPAVTVVIPTRDRWDALGPTLSRALGQEDVELEVVVVDDNSRTDPPASLRELADPRVRVLEGPRPRPGTGAQRRNRRSARRVDRVPRRRRPLGAAQAAHPARRGDPHGRAVRLRRRAAGRRRPSNPRALGRAHGRRARSNADGPLRDSGGSVQRHRVDSGGSGGRGIRREVLVLADWDLWIRLRDSAPLRHARRPLVAYVQRGDNMRATPGATWPRSWLASTRSTSTAPRRAHPESGSCAGSPKGHRAAGQRLTAARLELRAAAATATRPRGRAACRAPPRAYSETPGRGGCARFDAPPPGGRQERPSWL